MKSQEVLVTGNSRERRELELLGEKRSERRDERRQNFHDFYQDFSRILLGNYGPVRSWEALGGPLRSQEIVGSLRKSQDVLVTGNSRERREREIVGDTRRERREERRYNFLDFYYDFLRFYQETMVLGCPGKPQEVLGSPRKLQEVLGSPRKSQEVLVIGNSRERRECELLGEKRRERREERRQNFLDF